MDSHPLAPLLAELRRIHADGGLRVETGSVSDWYEVMLFPPAEDQAVAAAETRLRRKLPVDFQVFWRFTNGANLFVNESGLHGVGIASTELIVDLQEEEEDFYGTEALERYAVFARVNGSGDFLAFDLETGHVLDGIHSEQPREWRPIAASFTHWLESLIRADGGYYWLEALYQAGV
ncbi:MAG: SMI1/KNR4 family protein [Armatimonadota bacterium]